MQITAWFKLKYPCLERFREINLGHNNSTFRGYMYLSDHGGMIDAIKNSLKISIGKNVALWFLYRNSINDITNKNYHTKCHNVSFLIHTIRIQPLDFAVPTDK